MVLDKIENAARYAGLGKRFAQSFDLLRTGKLGEKEAGTYEVDGKRLYYMVQRYNTKPAAERRFESHRKYADIQVVLSGREIMGYHHVPGLEVTSPYDEAKDIMFFGMPSDYIELKVGTGEFVVLFPDEGHMPQVQMGSPTQVVKIVFKVLIEG